MRRCFLINLGLLAVLAILTGCTREGGEAETFSVQPVLKPRVPEAVLIGKERYTRYCSPCHGPDGRGDGPNASSLPVRLRDFKVIRPGKRDEKDYLKTVIRDGGAPVGLSRLMPAYSGTLSQEEISDIADFISHLRKRQEIDR